MAPTTGAIGLKGERGPQGPTGNTGPTGQQGPQGSRGEKGNPGAKGNDGLKGPIGNRGPKGDSGIPGETVNIGITGPAGATGPMGPAGATGPMGADGAPGATGNTGDTGPPGQNGTNGVDGAPSESSTINNINLSTYYSTLSDGNLNISLPSNTNNFIYQDIQTNIWQAINEGIPSGTINVIALESTGFIVGGTFIVVFNGANYSQPLIVNNIARYNTITSTWSALLGGTSGNVSAIVRDSAGDFYIGGQFSQVFAFPDKTGITQVNGIVKWNTSSSSWSVLNFGFSTSNVLSLAIDNTGTFVYAGGTFASAYNIPNSTSSSTPVLNIARWNVNTQIWSALVAGAGASSSSINALKLSSDNFLYVGGSFASVSGVVAANVAKFNLNTSTWSAVGGGVAGPSTTVVRTISIDYNQNVYCGGTFTYAYNGLNFTQPIYSANIVKFNSSSLLWESLSNGVNSTVNSSVIDNIGNLYIGGLFTLTNNYPITNINRIAIWKYNNWTPLANGFNSTVNSLTITSTNKLLVGGNFTTTTYAFNVLNPNIFGITTGLAESSMNLDNLWGIDLSVNGKFLHNLDYGNNYNVTVTNSGTPFILNLENY